MSFGRAAQSGRAGGFARPRDMDSCPCGSGASFADCCRDVIANRSAPTAEALMKSRYTAFVTGNARYLRATWDPATAPDSLELDPQVRWRGLEITAVDAGGPADERGIVAFVARRDDGALRERSRFVRRDDAWWYVDGELS